MSCRVSLGVQGGSPVPPQPRYQEAEETCFLCSPDRQGIVWIMNTGSGVTGDRRLGIDLARKGNQNRTFNMPHFN